MKGDETMLMKKKLLPEYSTKALKVFSIPQTLAIRLVGVKFVGGGHHYVYSEIPKGEIWVATELFETLEGKYFVFHELYEHHKMAMGMNYDDAHLLANKIEGKARNTDEKTLDEMIKREMEKNKGMIFERSHFNGTLGLHKGNGEHHAFHRKRDHHERRRPNALAMVR
jgi:hypothetical protein